MLICYYDRKLGAKDQKYKCFRATDLQVHATFKSQHHDTSPGS